MPRGRKAEQDAAEKKKRKADLKAQFDKIRALVAIVKANKKARAKAVRLKRDSAFKHNVLNKKLPKAKFIAVFMRDKISARPKFERCRALGANDETASTDAD